MQSHVYILFSLKLNKYYVGSTTDLRRRLVEHNRGKEKFTKTGVPWLFVYSEAFGQITAARKRELEINKKKAGNILKASYAQLDSDSRFLIVSQFKSFDISKLLYFYTNCRLWMYKWNLRGKPF